MSESEKFEPRPYAKPVRSWQCPHCGHVGDLTPAADTLDENGNRVMRWQCVKCEGYCRKPSSSEPLAA